MEELNAFYGEHPALWDKDYEREGFVWLDCHQEQKCIYAFERTGRRERIAAVFNFSDREWKEYTLSVPGGRKLRPLLSSQWEVYGGIRKRDSDELTGQDGEFVLSLPPYSGSYFQVD